MEQGTRQARDTIVKSYLKDESASIAIMTALGGLVLLMGVGVALDYNNMTREHVRLQASMDAAVLAATSRVNSTESELREHFEAAFHTNYTLTGGHEPKHFDLDVDVKDMVLEASATLDYQPFLMNIFGHNDLPINVRAASPVTFLPDMDIALALDITQSMADTGNLDDLKFAVSDMLDILQDSPGETRVSVVPYNQYVNVGVDKATEPWLSVGPTVKIQKPVSKDSPIYANRIPPTCYDTGERRPVYIDIDGAVELAGYEPVTVCLDDGYKGDIVGVQKKKRNGSVKKYAFEGCVASRDKGLDKVPQASLKTQIPAAMDYKSHRTIQYPNIYKKPKQIGDNDKHNVACGQEVTPLNGDLAFVKSKVKDLSGLGDTYLPTGLLWGWRTLTQGAPLSTPLTPTLAASRNYKRILVFMTDGENTTEKIHKEQNTEYYHVPLDMSKSRGVSRSKLGVKKAAEICELAKQDDVEIYTISYKGTGGFDSETRKMLRKCATRPSYAFQPNNRDELLDAFRTITQSQQVVRVSF